MSQGFLRWGGGGSKTYIFVLDVPKTYILSTSEGLTSTLE